MLFLACDKIAQSRVSCSSWSLSLYSNTLTIWYWKITNSVKTKYSFLIYEKPTLLWLRKNYVKICFRIAQTWSVWEKNALMNVLFMVTSWRIIQKGLWFSIVKHQVKLLVRTCFFCVEITCGVVFFQECFYQCSPHVYKYAMPNITGAISGTEILLVFVSYYYFVDYWQSVLILEVRHTS